MSTTTPPGPGTVTESFSTLSKQKYFGQYSNHIKLGIIGTTNIGKSSLFNVFSRNENMQASNDDSLFCTIDPYITIIDPYDYRINFMADRILPQSISHSKITVMDSAGLVQGSFKQGSGVGVSSLSPIKSADVILHVVRAFENFDIVHYEGRVDPIRDIDIVNQEILLMDLDTIESGIVEIEHLTLQQLGGENLHFQFETLMKAWEFVAGEPRPEPPWRRRSSMLFKKMKMPERCTGYGIRFGKWSQSEMDFLSNYNFFTAKNTIYLFNVSSRDYLRKGKQELFDKFAEAVTGLGGFSEIIMISLELEQNLLSIENQGEIEEYVAANPTHVSILPEILRETHRTLNIIHFFTFNGKELKSWCLRQGETVLEAANRVDVHIMRNFIRGDVIAFEEYEKFDGDRLKLKKEGKIKQETKKYIVNDGDIIEFFFHKKEK